MSASHIKTPFRNCLFALAGLFIIMAANGYPAFADNGIAMHGMPKYGADFSHFDYVNPEAPKGGTLRLAHVGGFDSLNRHIIRGTPAQGLEWTQLSLLYRSRDEPFSLYAGVAESVDLPDDRQSIAFTLRQGAKFHDGSEVTVDDIVASLETLRDQGRPNHRYFYSQVSEIERLGPRQVRLHFNADGNREIPLILALMPVLSKADIDSRDFEKTTLEPMQGTGPYQVDKVEQGRFVRYRRVKDWWGDTVPALKGQFNFEEVRYDYYRDNEAALLAFKADEYDLRNEKDPRRWATRYDFPAVAAGHVILSGFPHQRPTGMYGLVLNGRRQIFQDPVLRQAIGYGLDFEWLNANLYHGAYHRTASYFENSVLAATGLPTDAERALLTPFASNLAPEVFSKAYIPPGQDLPDQRARLRAGRDLLEKAGYEIRGGQLIRTSDNMKIGFEIMLVRRENEKIALHLQRNLKRLGISVAVRLVDTAQFQDRRAQYDYDAMFNLWGQSLSPGNEQSFYWSQDAAGREGTRNYGYVKSPAVDAMIEAIVAARRYDQLTAAVRAMDRVLLWGHHVVPLFHQKKDTVAYWNRFGVPAVIPSGGYRIETWWHDPAKARTIE